jgi:hypothetical protein
MEKRIMAQTCPHCGALHTDATDDKAEAQGLLYFAEAGRRLGRSASFVHGLIRSGALRTTRFAGRDYVDASSVDRVLGSIGVPDRDGQKLEQLEEIGRGWSHEALVIRERMQQRAKEYELSETGSLAGIGRSNALYRTLEPEEVDPITAMKAKYPELVKRAAKGGA